MDEGGSKDDSRTEMTDEEEEDRRDVGKMGGEESGEDAEGRKNENHKDSSHMQS